MANKLARRSWRGVSAQFPGQTPEGFNPVDSPCLYFRSVDVADEELLNQASSPDVVFALEFVEFINYCPYCGSDLRRVAEPSAA